MNNEVPTQETEQAMQACASELAALKERYSYLASDFENYRRNQERDRITMTIAAQANVLRDLLSVIDDFERAFQEISGTTQASELSQRLAGFELIYKNVRKLLADYGVTEITEQGNFDPNIHEALLHVQAPDKQSGQVVAMLRKGYRFKGQVLRPAHVSVAV